MYLGNNFKKYKIEGIKKLNCEEHLYILSSNNDYCLLDQDDEIHYYDVYLGKQKETLGRQSIKSVKRKIW